MGQAGQRRRRSSDEQASGRLYSPYPAPDRVVAALAGRSSVRLELASASLNMKAGGPRRPSVRKHSPVWQQVRASHLSPKRMALIPLRSRACKGRRFAPTKAVAHPRARPSISSDARLVAARSIAVIWVTSSITRGRCPTLRKTNRTEPDHAPDRPWLRDRQRSP
jgi:hypothetical protein